MLPRILSVLVFSLLIIPTTYGYTKVEKIGVVDLIEVFDKFVEDKDIAKEFNEYKRASKEKLESMSRDLNSLRLKIIEISNKIVSMGTNVDYQTAQDYRKITGEYDKKLDEYLSEARKTEENLNKYRDSLRQYVYRDIINYIRTYGDRNGFTIIFDTRGNVIYYSKGNDITSDLNKWIKVQEDAKKKY
ncbi:MAG: OmpH family outer membrane protein [Brevinematales bacterium]|nr:OmpH family outer membrane protein [Brevinematales bacterium]